MWNGTATVESNLNIELPYDPTISLLGENPKELKAGTQTDGASHMAQW